jgi:glycosyltransferase involved in cell wall biosynthesis
MVVYAPYPLGETRVQREAEALLRHGYEVDVICSRLSGEPSIDRYKGVRVFRERYWPKIPFLKRAGLSKKLFDYFFFFIMAAARITALNHRNHYTTIQVHNIPDFLVFCALIPKLLGVPILLDLHDLMPEFYAGHYGDGKSLAARLIRLQERLSCRFADQVITVSEHWRQALNQRGVPEKKCSVVMNLADESIFHPPGQVNQPCTLDGFRLIYHGSFQERYGLDLAIRAVDRLRPEIPEIHLILVGNGQFLPQMERLVEELDLDRHVTINSLRLAEDLPGIILACHLGIVAYRNDVFTDGLLPTKLMEYACLGFPAIAACTSTIHDYFADTMVEFFEPGNLDDLVRCIRFLYHHPECLEELRRGSQKFNQRYNWAKTSAEYVRLVEEIGHQS